MPRHFANYCKPDIWPSLGRKELGMVATIGDRSYTTFQRLHGEPNQFECNLHKAQDARLPKELIQLFVNPDALGVASGRESTIRYNSVDVIAGLAH